MNSFLHLKLIYNMTSNIKIKNNQSVLLAISGGQDSLCLLQLFLDIQKIIHINLAVVHIDHQWRQDATKNTEHIINIIRKITCPLYLYQLQPAYYSEAEFRDMRYQIYMKTASTYKYDIIATAHTLSDKTETCLMNLIKGSNIDNLNNIVWTRKIDTNITLVRPLLNFTRAEINWFCKYYRLPVWFDYSNIHYENTRNRIRYELIPYLQQYYQIDIEKNIDVFLGKTYHDTEYLRQTTVKVYLLIKHPKYIALNHQILQKQHPCIQIRVLHLFIVHNTMIRCNYHLLKQILNELYSFRKIYKINNNLTLKIDGSWAYIRYTIFK
uniref:tRNA(Ile)-lysidine synthase, chloroplastic n=1 Tax=Izziella formosana TaxID=1653389 RepID=A0A1G4NUE3_9FLOR|nr:tRNA Ile-lysidine synthetase [Izziella formosana]SCW22313.1 tRNA Ile-lysidine synthetase [Izziella formosana]